MHHFEKIARGLADQGLDAMLLTGEANRFYASGFHSAGTDGVALVTKEKAYYFTDSRYTEAAERCVRDAEACVLGRIRLRRSRRTIAAKMARQIRLTMIPMVRPAGR